MKFIDGLLAVQDMERAKIFYEKYLNQDVIIDYGENVTLTGGPANARISARLYRRP